jgi:hypothetical protein
VHGPTWEGVVFTDADGDHIIPDEGMPPLSIGGEGE